MAAPHHRSCLVSTARLAAAVALLFAPLLVLDSVPLPATAAAAPASFVIPQPAQASIPQPNFVDPSVAVPGIDTDSLIQDEDDSAAALPNVSVSIPPLVQSREESVSAANDVSSLLLAAAASPSGGDSAAAQKKSDPPKAKPLVFALEQQPSPSPGQQCHVAPASFDNIKTRYYIVECPTAAGSGNTRVTVDFSVDGTAVETDNKEADKKGKKDIPDVYDMSGSVVKSFKESLAAGEFRTHYVQTCGDVKISDTCFQYQIDLHRVSANSDPKLKHLSFSNLHADSQQFDPSKNELNVTLYSHQPVSIAASSSVIGTFVDNRPILPERGAVDGYTIFSYTPTVEEGGYEQLKVYVTNDDKSAVKEYTVHVDTVRSVDPTLEAVGISPGRLEPVFAPHYYSYFARVPEGTKRVRLDLTAVNRRDTRCSVNGGGAVQGNQSVDVSVDHLNDVITIDCMAADVAYKVRYVFTVVQQLGGATTLSSLDVVGADISPSFTPLFAGPYKVDLAAQHLTDLKWLAFDIETTNKRAIVKIDGTVAELPHGISRYYKIPSGGRRMFKITVRTPENPVEELYEVEVLRPVPYLSRSSTGEDAAQVLGWGAAAVAASGGSSSFMSTAKFLQFLSMSHWLNGNPESFDGFAGGMNKWNMQFEFPHDDFYVKSYPTGVKTVSDFPFNSTMPPQQYNEFLKLAELSSSSISASLVNDHSEAFDAIVDQIAASVSDSDVSSQQLTASLGNILRSKLDGAISSAASYDAKSQALTEDKEITARRLLTEVLQNPLRVLKPIADPAYKQELMTRLDAENKQHQKLLFFSASVLLTTALIGTVGLLYALLWVFYLRSPADFLAIRRDFPSWLHPSRFWTFMFDFFLISYLQGCVGLAVFGVDGTVVHMAGFDFRPKSLLWMTIAGLILYPIMFISIATYLLTRIRKDCVWSRCLNRYHDRQCYEGSATHSYFKWLPSVIAQFFAYEIVGVIPICRPADGNPGDSHDQHEEAEILFNEDSFHGGPWHSSDPHSAVHHHNQQRTHGGRDLEASLRQQPPGVNNSSYGALVSPDNLGSLAHDATTDRVRVQLLETEDESRFWDMYEHKNDSAMHVHGDATVAYDSFRVKNAYDHPLNVELEVQLKHLPKIAQTTMQATMWMPYDNLRLTQVDAWGQLFGKAQRGNMFYWTLDRLATVIVVVAATCWIDAGGNVQKMIFLTASLILTMIYLPAAISTGSAKWYKAMQQEVHRIEKAKRRDEAHQSAMTIWPFEQGTAKSKLQRDLKRSDKLWCGINGIYKQHIAMPLQQFLKPSGWRTRFWLTTREVLCGPAMTEFMKALIVLEIMLGSRYLSFKTEGVQSTMAVIWSTAAILSLNVSQIGALIADVQRIFWELWVFSRRWAYSFVDYCFDVKHTGDRVSHFASQFMSSLMGKKNYSLMYPGRASTVQTRDYTVKNVAIVQNEVGLHFPGAVREDNSSTAPDDLAKCCDTMHYQRQTILKTIHRVGKLGAWRPDIDTGLPISVSFRQFYFRRQDKLAATIQIVNHSHLRFPNSQFKRSSGEDDSFLSLYTDPKLVPPQGDIVIRKRHGYAVHYLPELNQLIIRGPAIRGADREYTATTAGSRAQRHRLKHDSSDDYSSSDNATTESSAWSNRVATGSGEAFCTDAGKLSVTVGIGQTPDPYSDFHVHSPSGKKITINPMEIEVLYSSVGRKLTLSSQHFLPSGYEAHQKYRVEWKVQNNRHPVSGRGVAHEAGTVAIQLDKAGGCPDLSKVITLRDTKSFVVVIDPKQTDAYHVNVPSRRPGGISSFASHALTQFTASSETHSTASAVIGSSSHPPTIPCTVIQCVNPVKRRMRVEPNFNASLRTQNALLEEVNAKIAALKQPNSLAHLCSWALPISNVIKLYAENGVNIEADGRVVHPLLEPSHPSVMSQSKQIREVESRIRAEVESRLKMRLAQLRESIKMTKEWAKAYNDNDLAAAQYKVHLLESADNAPQSDLMLNIAKLKALKFQYERSIPGFVYPMSVDATLLSKKPNYGAQMELWREQVKQWLEDEEAPMTMPSASSPFQEKAMQTLHMTLVTDEIMRGLRECYYRQEDLNKGQLRSVMHFLCDSVRVRGNDVNWKPDPLCATNASVRLFRATKDGRADFTAPEWIPCSLKLTANAVKIVIPAQKDLDRKFKQHSTAPWRHISGKYIPLKCFEKVEVAHDPLSPIERKALGMIGCVDTKIVFRKNQQIFVDDRHVRRIEDDLFDNVCQVGGEGSNSSTESDDYAFMIGHCVDVDESRQWPHNEVDSSIPRVFDNKLNIHPLTFRSAASIFEKWRDAIACAQMDKQPRDPDEWFDGRVRMGSMDDSLPTKPASPPSSEASPASLPISEESIPPTPTTARYDGEFMNSRYHGKGKLFDHDGKCVYEGEWANGQRWGTGICSFRDHKGMEWQYTGHFEHDEMAGPGRLVLVDQKEHKRLQGSSEADDRWSIVAMEGSFRPAGHLRRRRRGTGPPVAEYPKIAADLLKKVILENQKEFIKGGSSSSSSSSDSVSKVELLIDVRRTMSATGDCYLLDKTMAELGQGYDNRLTSRPLKEHPPRSTSSSSSSSSSSSASGPHMRGPAEDVSAIVEEYMPHRSRWLRAVDPNLGFQGLPQRFGKGSITFANGSTYEGRLLNGKPSGRGFLDSPSAQLKYDGRWMSGKPHGKGILEWDDSGGQARYIGSFDQGKRNGQGTMTTHDGKVYLEGTWKDDVLWGGDKVVMHVDPSVAGKPTFQRYVGAMDEGLLQGDGKVTFLDGSIFSGGFSKSQRSGKGTLTDKSGKPVLIGSWKEDLPHGRVAKMVLPSGQMFSGDCVKGQRQGMGELYATSAGKMMYEGLWMGDKPSGRGSLWADDGEYEGEWKEGKRHGKGKFTYKELPTANGKQRVYEGDWKDDSQHGVGKYLDEHGIDYTYKFNGGELDAGTMKAYKKGMCGKPPQKGVSTKITPTKIKNEATAVFSKKHLEPKAVSSQILKYSAGSPWAAYETHKFKYNPNVPSGDRLRPSRSPISRPGSITGAKVPRKKLAADVLTVTLHEAKNLPNVHPDGKMDPFVRLKIAQKSKDTAVITNAGSNPKFNDANIRFFFDKKDAKHETLKIQVWDKSVLGRNEFVASTTLDLKEMVKKGQASASRDLPLFNRKQPAGTIVLTASINAYKAVEGKQTSVSSGSTSSSSSMGSRMGSPSTVISVAQEPIHTHNVKVEVHSARNLFEVADKMDPICRVSVGEHQRTTKRHRNGGRNPMWTEPFAFPPAGGDKVMFEVYHKDVKDNKEVFIGKGEVSTANRTVISDEVKLFREKMIPAGKLVVTIQVNE